MYDLRLKTKKELRQIIADSEQRYMTALFLLTAKVSQGVDVGWTQQMDGLRRMHRSRIVEATAILASR